MKTFYSSQEIEDLARQGVRELLVDESVVLTDLARQTAALSGIRLVSGGKTGAATSPSPLPLTTSRGGQGDESSLRPGRVAAPAPIPARPRGCQHGPLGDRPASTASAASAPTANGSNPAAGGKVVEDLVGLVKQMSKR